MSVFTAPAAATDTLVALCGGDGLAGALNALDDASLYVNAADSLMTDDTLVVGSGVLNVGVEDTTYGILTLQPAGTGNSEGGKILLGVPADNDTTFANWVIDVFEDDLRIFSSDGTTSFFSMKANGVLEFGSDGDTNLYRSAANTLKTDDNLIIDGTVTSTAGSVITADGTQTLTDKTLTSPVITTPTIRAYDGWQDANETWTYAAADDPTFTFTIATFDATAKYSAGMKIKLTNTTVKYFIITKVTFDDPGSTITVYGGTSYNLVDAAISANYYSTQKAPLDFPLDPDKWTVETSDSGDDIESTPTQNVWTNTGSLTIAVPIGNWNLGYEANIQADDSGGANMDCFIALSTANNSSSDAELKGSTRATTATVIVGFVKREKIVNLTTKDTYYLNIMTDVASIDNIRIRGDYGSTIIRAVCAYL